MTKQKTIYHADFFTLPSGETYEKVKSVPFKTRKTVFEKYNYSCANCEVVVVIFKPLNVNDIHGHVDHIFPTSRGGRSDLANLQLLCVSCNQKKSNNYGSC